MKNLISQIILIWFLLLLVACGNPLLTAQPPITKTPTLSPTLVVYPGKTPTGFYWPTINFLERLNDYPNGDFLSDGCNPRISTKKPYYQNLIHTGKDIGADQGDWVYSIANGIIYSIDYNDKGDTHKWGLTIIDGKIVPNKAVIVQYWDSNQHSFFAIYGHIQ